MDIETDTIEANIPHETWLKVLAFNYARNKSFHNSIAELLEAGLRVKLSDIVAAPSFRDRYEDHLAAMKARPDGVPGVSYHKSE